MASASICGLASTLANFRMVDEVNDKLPVENQFDQIGWCGAKTLRLHREYKRLHPTGQFARKVRARYAAALISLAICAWCIGTFGK